MMESGSGEDMSRKDESPIEDVAGDREGVTSEIPSITVPERTPSRESIRRNSPTNAIIQWIEPGGNRKDAMMYAKDLALKRFDSINASYYAISPFLEGYLVEVQENGPGLSYLPAAMKALSDSRDPAWFRVGLRAFSVTMRDGRPYCLSKSEGDSQILFDGGIGELTPFGKMQPIIKQGEKVLALGATMLATGIAFFAITGTFYLLQSTVFVPEIRRLDNDILPYRQWPRVQNVPFSNFVNTLRFRDQQWTTQFLPLPKPVPGAAGGKPDGVTPIPGAPNPNRAAQPVPPAPARTIPDPVKAPEEEGIFSWIKNSIFGSDSPPSAAPQPVAPRPAATIPGSPTPVAPGSGVPAPVPSAPAVPQFPREPLPVPSVQKPETGVPGQAPLPQVTSPQAPAPLPQVQSPIPRQIAPGLVAPPSGPVNQVPGAPSGQPLPESNGVVPPNGVK